MSKKKILFFIPVSDETYAKWQIKKAKIAAFAVPASIGATIGAAWYGYCQSIGNSIKIDKVEKRTAYCIDNHAECIREVQDHLKELERQNNLLLEKAFRDSVGEEEKSA